MTAKELEDRCRALAKACDGHVTLDFEDGYCTATLTREAGLICCCRAGAEEALLALEQAAPGFPERMVAALALAKAGGKAN